MTLIVREAYKLRKYLDFVLDFTEEEILKVDLVTKKRLRRVKCIVKCTRRGLVGYKGNQFENRVVVLIRRVGLAI